MSHTALKKQRLILKVLVAATVVSTVGFGFATWKAVVYRARYRHYRAELRGEHYRPQHSVDLDRTPPTPIPFGKRYHYSLQKIIAAASPPKLTLQKRRTFVPECRWQQDVALLKIPGLSEGEYTTGYLLNLTVARIPPGIQPGILKIRCRANFAGNRKDFVSASVNGRQKRVCYFPTKPGEHEFRFFLGPVVPDDRITIALLGQHAGGRRDTVAELTITDVMLDVVDSVAKTNDYVSKLDLQALRLRGSDYANERFSLARVEKDFNSSYSYDFAALAELEEGLQGIDRPTVLRKIFKDLTEGAKTNIEKHLRVLSFVHQNSFHNKIQPMYPDGRAVYDPLLLLELAEYRCGHGARLLCDLFESVGFETRLVQVVAHVSAEVYYDGGWHLLEGSFFANGSTPRLPSGKIPSVLELRENPALLDRLPSSVEPLYGVPWLLGSAYFSWFFVAEEAYRGRPTVKFGYYIKNPTENGTWDRYFGWHNYRSVVDPRMIPLDVPHHHLLPPPIVQSISIGSPVGNRREVTLTWDTFGSGRKDDADSLESYRVFVSEESRGWNFQDYKGPEDMRPFLSHPEGWQPAMYDHLNSLPKSEIACLDTKEKTASFSIPEDKVVFVNLMARDKYGISIGREIFCFAYEYVIQPGTAKEVDEVASRRR